LYYIDGLKYITITEIGTNKALKFLVDTGATSNIIKMESIKNYHIEPGKVNFEGIGGKFSTKGKIWLKWKCEGFEGVDQFCVGEDIPLATDEILGSGFMEKYKAIINCENFTITLAENNFNICIPLESENRYNISTPGKM
jgi:Retroviral aspartyl protease